MSTVPKTQTRDDVWETLKEKLGLKETRTSEVHSASTGWNSQKLLAPCGDGERTAHLTGLAGSYLARGFNVDQVIEHCLMWNERNTPPLGVEKIISTCKSIAATDARNHPERTLGQGHAFGLMQTRIPPTPLFDLQAGRIDRYLQTPPPARRWLIKDLVVLGKVGAIVAPGGSSKSQWLLQLAVGVSTGLAVAEHWQVGEPG